MLSDSEIQTLERDCERWSTAHRLLVFFIMFAALFSLPISMAVRSPFLTIVPFILLGIGFGGDYLARRWKGSVRERIEAHYRRKFMHTRWTTPAGAEGVVVEVKCSGRRLSLAFASGATESYAREVLTRSDAEA